MRRKDRAVTESEANTILETGEYGVLSTISAEGKAYGVPLNYCKIDDDIFFHCASDGRKIDIITANPNVSFCVVGKTEVLAEQFSTRYESCIVEGIASEAFEEEKHAALQGLIQKYSAAFLEEGRRYIEKFEKKTRVFKITVTSVTGKSNR